MLDVHRIVTGSLRENCYVVAHPQGDAVVIDPGGEFEQIARHVDAEGLSVHAVIATHAHHDHLSAAGAVVEEYGAPFHLHPADDGLLSRANFFRRFLHREDAVSMPVIDVPLEDGTTLHFGAFRLSVLHTPGHTAGSTCFWSEGELFTGDTVMTAQNGLPGLPGGDRRALEASMAELVRRYPPETMVRPGHGEPAALGEVLPARHDPADLLA